jgi:phosphomannomutase
VPREHLLKIGVSGIRGVVGPFLTPQIARAFAQAFGTYVGPGRVVVGRDTRSSGPMLQHAVHCGLVAAGCEVIDVDILPTPTIQLYTGTIGARGGLAITASHNPPEYNALKMFNSAGLFFNHYELSELLDIYNQSVFHEAVNAEIRPVIYESGTPSRLHIERVIRQVDVERIRARKFRVALDAVNGAGAVLVPQFLRDALGCELHAISIDPTKPFPRVPEPRPDTLGDLSELVRAQHCDIGFGLDPDGDRLAVADETGRVLDNDDVLVVAVDAVLARAKLGAAAIGPVVVNLTTTAAIDDIASAHGVAVHRSAVGEANVVEMMLGTQAVIGGEGGNGGVIFPAVQHCRDSLAGMALWLDRLASFSATATTRVSELTAALPSYYRRSTALPFPQRCVPPLLRTVKAHWPEAKLDSRDGLKLILSEGWIHVRSSNTEPVLRVSVESKEEAAADALLTAVLQAARELAPSEGRGG